MSGLELNDYLELKDGVVWMLSNDSIYYSKDDGATAVPTKLNGESACSKLIRIDEKNVLVFCQGVDYQRFLNVKADTELRPIQTSTFTIPSNFSVTNIHRSIYSGKLYLLDNDKLGKGKGIIRIFKVETNQDGSPNDVVP